MAPRPAVELTVRSAGIDDASYIARHLREADRLEVMAASGRPPLEGLLVGVAAKKAFVWTADGVPCAIFGVVPLQSNTGSIWLVGTDEMEKHAVRLLRFARPWVELLNMQFPLLVNTADARNTLHHKFIRWTGFTFFAERQLNGLRFIDFARILHV